jgi:hypothetical protein
MEYSPDSNDVGRDAEESQLLGSVTRKSLGKTINDCGLACAVAICKVCRSEISL